MSSTPTQTSPGGIQPGGGDVAQVLPAMPGGGDQCARGLCEEPGGGVLSQVG